MDKSQSSKTVIRLSDSRHRNCPSVCFEFCCSMSFVTFGEIAEKLGLCAKKSVSERYYFKFFSKIAASLLLSAAFLLPESVAYTPVKAVIVIDANKNKVI